MANSNEELGMETIDEHMSSSEAHTKPSTKFKSALMHVDKDRAFTTLDKIDEVNDVSQ